jgi:hypothetical protein
LEIKRLISENFDNKNHPALWAPLQRRGKVEGQLLLEGTPEKNVKNNKRYHHSF